MVNLATLRVMLASAIAVCLFAVGASGQTTWYVDDDAPNDPGPGDPNLSDPNEVGTADHPFDAIQEGIDAATGGDTVLVADGVYSGTGNKDLYFSGKAITVRGSSGDPELCIIDCEADGRGFSFYSEGSGAVVETLTITNGNANRGAGVYFGGSSSATLIDCIIRDNTASDSGGGVCCYGDGNPTISGCTIRDNWADNAGGGIYCYYYDPGKTAPRTTPERSMVAAEIGTNHHRSAHPLISSCKITGNSASTGGGIACSSDSTPTVTECIILRNSASGNGGGIYCSNNPTITDCEILENSTGQDGGGVYCSNAPTIANCMISANSADDDGGGFYCHGGSSPMLTNCLIRENSARSGGGAFCNDSSATLTNCTITSNFAADSEGGGIYSEYGISKLSNCILWSNVPDEIRAIPGFLDAAYCDVQGGWLGVGNIDADPQFALTGDLHLMPNSPCIDAGTNSPDGGLPSHDFEGNSRPVDGDGDSLAVADMGAYEFNPLAPAIAISPSAFEFSATEGGGNPSDDMLLLRNCGGGTLNWGIVGEPAWLSVSPSSGQSDGETDQVTLGVDTTGLSHGAYSVELQAADAQAANSPRSVTVTLYINTTLDVPSEYPTIQAAIDAASVPGDEVLVADGTHTGDGNRDIDFRGRAITVRGVSGDPAACVIDCNEQGRGFYFHSHESSNSILEAVTIMNGVADNGGGVSCTDHSNPTLDNCVVRDNSASSRGGGVYCYGGSSPTLAYCTITANSASSDGGGVYCGNDSNPVITQCTIDANIASDDGGGVSCWDSSPTIVGGTINQNSAGDDGGGIHCSVSSPQIDDCQISMNSGQSGGGIHSDFDSNPTLTDCAIIGNAASLFGGGVSCYTNGGALTLVRCTIAENLTSSYGGGVYVQDDNDDLVLDSCLVRDNAALHMTEGDGGGIYLAGGSVFLTNTLFARNMASNNGGAIWSNALYLEAMNCTLGDNVGFVYGGSIAFASLSDSFMRNCIMWNNQGGIGQEIAVLGAGDVTVVTSVVMGGEAATFSDGLGEVLWGLGSIDADPLFADPNNDDYRITAGSPCIDAGDNLLVTSTVDLDGNTRFADDPGMPDIGFGTAPIVDMGAYEFQGSSGAIDCPGDLDGDNTVGLSDLATLLAHYGMTSGATYGDGDLDGDGDVDLADLATLLAVYGAVCE